MTFSPTFADLSPTFSRFVGMVAERGAYGVVSDMRGLILIGEDPNGDCRLPGGRQEKDESPRDALTREAREEVGWSIEIGQPLGRSLVIVRDGAGVVAARYYRAAPLQVVNEAPEYRAWWLSPEEAIRNLHRDGDRQAIEWACSGRAGDASTMPLLSAYPG